MEEYQIREEERERIKKRFAKLLKEVIDKRKATAKTSRTKNSIPVSLLHKLEIAFNKRIDNPNYDTEHHW